MSGGAGVRVSMGARERGCGANRPFWLPATPLPGRGRRWDMMYGYDVRIQPESVWVPMFPSGSLARGCPHTSTFFGTALGRGAAGAYVALCVCVDVCVVVAGPVSGCACERMGVFSFLLLLFLLLLILGMIFLHSSLPSS